MSADNRKFDVVVIGSGPGGYTAAIRAGQLGLKVAIVEREEKLGGVCLNWGCIPTKALLKQAEVFNLVQRADEFGIEVGKVKANWHKIIGRSRAVADGLANGVSYLMKKNKIEIVSGQGRITPSKKVEVANENDDFTETLETSNIIIATGSKPKTIPGVEIDANTVLSSKESMVLDAQPKSLLIIGAGAIGIEFAYFYNSFGTEVTVLEALPQVLPREDAEIAGLLATSLSKQGIRIEVNAVVESVNLMDGSAEVSFVGAAGKETKKVEKVLMAVGVSGYTEGLGLEALGVAMNRGDIQVDGRLQTNVKGVYAIGDVVGPPQLAHMATAEGIAAAEFIAGKERAEIDRTFIPSCVYCQPQVASVGLTEEQAKAAGHEIKVGRFPFAASGKAQAIGDTDGLVKLVFGERYGEVMGASIIGSEATELVAEVGLAAQLEATYEEILSTVHAHPTLSESVMEAAGEAFGEAVNI